MILLFVQLLKNYVLGNKLSLTLCGAEVLSTAPTVQILKIYESDLSSLSLSVLIMCISSDC